MGWLVADDLDRLLSFEFHSRHRARAQVVNRGPDTRLTRGSASDTEIRGLHGFRAAGVAAEGMLP